MASRFLASWTLQNWTVQVLNHLPFLLLVWGPYGFPNFPSTKKAHELTQRLPEYTAPSATRMSKFKTQTKFNRQESSGWLHPCVSPSSYQPRNWRNDFPSLVFFKIYFCLCVWLHCLNVYVHLLSAWYLGKSEKGAGSPGNGSYREL